MVQPLSGWSSYCVWGSQLGKHQTRTCIHRGVREALQRRAGCIASRHLSQHRHGSNQRAEFSLGRQCVCVQAECQPQLTRCRRWNRPRSCRKEGLQCRQLCRCERHRLHRRQRGRASSSRWSGGVSWQVVRECRLLGGRHRCWVGVSSSRRQSGLSGWCAVRRWGGVRCWGAWQAWGRGSRLHCGWRRFGRSLGGAGLWSCGLLSTARTEVLSGCSHALPEKAGTSTSVGLNLWMLVVVGS